MRSRCCCCRCATLDASRLLMREEEEVQVPLLDEAVLDPMEEEEEGVEVDGEGEEGGAEGEEGGAGNGTDEDVEDVTAGEEEEDG